MSWYVQQLIFNSEVIRDGIEDNFENMGGSSNRDYYDDEGGDNPLTYTEFFFDSDCYIDLLDIEMAISFLGKVGLITKKELEVLKLAKTGLFLSDIAERLKLSLVTVQKRFSSCCNKVAYHLGEHFTNEGYMQQFVEKYELNEKQVEKLVEYMEKNTL